MVDTELGLNCTETRDQSISWESGREGGAEVRRTGIAPAARQSVSSVTTSAGSVTRHQLISVRVFLYCDTGVVEKLVTRSLLRVNSLACLVSSISGYPSRYFLVSPDDCLNLI